jgi:hypothetical protein
MHLTAICIDHYDHVLHRHNTLLGYYSNLLTALYYYYNIIMIFNLVHALSPLPTGTPPTQLLNIIGGLITHSEVICILFQPHPSYLLPLVT